VLPDAMALAKGLGAGIPIGAMLVKEKYAHVLGFPSHGSTFGGNPVACAAALVVMQNVSQPQFLSHVRAMGEVLRMRLGALKQKYPQKIRDVRGKGLFWGVEFAEDPSAFRDQALRRGLIVNFCADRVLRVAPPLVISEAELKRALSIVEELFDE
jgi:acetylornithine/succinyldiaminopimelate/putrescine aminotransferase